jgi:hypothetical protein
LSEATREICEQIKKMIKGGELAPDKHKMFIERLLNDLVKAKTKPRPDSNESPDLRP